MFSRVTVTVHFLSFFLLLLHTLVKHGSQIFPLNVTETRQYCMIYKRIKGSPYSFCQFHRYSPLFNIYAICVENKKKFRKVIMISQR